MNIERMQKINELARQLVDQGIYPDLMEATKHAEHMLNKGDEGISSIFETEKRIAKNSGSSGSESSGSVSAGPGSSNDSSYAQQPSDDELKMQLRKLSFQVSEQSRSITELKSQLTGLLRDIEQMKLQPRQSHLLEKKCDNPQTHLNKEAVEKKPHARSGNYESSDVAVEKFFYSGPPK